MHPRRSLLAVLLLAVLACDAGPSESPRVVHVVVDSAGPKDPWGKAVGDVNRDGHLDLIVAGRSGGGLVWYEGPTWARHTLNDSLPFSTDEQLADIDGDGRPDMVTLLYAGLAWLRADDWSLHMIDTLKLHDLEVADFDGDGRLDVAARGQTAFGDAPPVLHLYYQDSIGWTARHYPLPRGEGFKAADLDADGRIDLAINAAWLHNPGQRDSVWTMRTFGPDWTWPDVKVEIADLNGDGRLDLALTPAEKPGDHYRISWFEHPADPAGPWPEHVIDPMVESAFHSLVLVDFDLDGHVDLVTAAMHQSSGPGVYLYRNLGQGATWERERLSRRPSHGLAAGDLDGDGDVDLLGANWEGPHQAVELWLNQLCTPGATCSAAVKP